MNQQLYDERDLPVEELEKIGLAKDGKILLDEKDVQTLLAGRRTQLLRLEKLKDNDLEIPALDARLSLRAGRNGKPDLLLHPIYKTALRPAYLTEDEALKLQQGEVSVLWLMADKEKGRNKEILVEFDRETNEFVITDTEDIIVPDLVNSEKLSEEQKRDFKWGKEVKLQEGTTFRYTGLDEEGMRSDRFALIASLLIDGGVTYLVYHGLKSLFGKKHEHSDSVMFSAGYYQALLDMQKKNEYLQDRLAGLPNGRAEQQNRGHGRSGYSR